LLKLVESFEDKDHVYIVTEYLSGGDLYSYLNRQKIRPLAEEHAKQVLRQVAKGLRVLHRRHIIHRDIKLHNILVSQDSSTSAPTFILADFGSACQLKSAADTSSFDIGTKGFYAPEMLLNRPYNCALDVFQLGIVLFALLANKLPFNIKDTQKYEESVIQ